MNDIAPPERRFPDLKADHAIAPELKAAGWKPVPARDYPAMIGPFLARHAGEGWEYAFLPEQRHLNIGGVVHGGMLMSFVDDVLGMTVWEAAGRKPVTTVQLNNHFISPGKLGELIIGRGEVLRATRSVVFIRGMLTQGDKVLTHADGVWKILGSN
jgi:acyl-coenzyme A thioesterase PaaI-like protein